MKFGEFPVDDIAISAIGGNLAFGGGIKCAMCGGIMKTVEELYVQNDEPHGIICKVCDGGQ